MNEADFAVDGLLTRFSNSVAAAFKPLLDPIAIRNQLDREVHEFLGAESLSIRWHVFEQLNIPNALWAIRCWTTLAEDDVTPKTTILPISEVNFVKYPSYTDVAIQVRERTRTLYEELVVEIITWDDVILPEPIKEEVRRNATRFLRAHQQGSQLKLPSSRSLLLSGPPGTGKTLVGKALTSELDGITFLWVTPGGFDYFGDPGYFFRWARERTPAVVFLEDLDLVAEIRGTTSTLGPVLGVQVPLLAFTKPASDGHSRRVVHSWGPAGGQRAPLGTSVAGLGLQDSMGAP